MSRKVAYSIAIIILVVGTIILYPKVALFLASRKNTLNRRKVEFYIKEPMNAQQLANELVIHGIIKKGNALVKVAEFKGLNEKNIAIGKYIIAPKTEYRTLLNGFKLNAAGNGNAEVEVEIRFNNCRDIYQLAGKVSANLILDSAKLVDYLHRPDVLEKYGFTKEELPAMFSPNTYRMYYDTDEKSFANRMNQEFVRFWTPERITKLHAVGLKKPSDAVTLASIVYSEQTRKKDEWPIIAGLYLNRLKIGMKLQSDPTFKFCWGDRLKGVQRLLGSHRDIVCPYNTYKIKGLPPGPIFIPDAQVVEAVLNRTEHDYIFMMAKPNFSGYHDFSTEYATHARYAKIYQNWLGTILRNR